MKNILIVFSVYILLGVFYSTSASANCAAGYPCGERGVGTAGTACGNGEWENLLVTQESGGKYGAKARGSKCPTCTASGRYQFIDSTRKSLGQKASLPCSDGKFGSADHTAFLNCKGLQDDYARALWKNDLNGLMSDPKVAAAVNNGTQYECPVTASGITAMAHNVGPQCAKLWAKGGEAYMKANGPVFKGVPSGTPACTDAFGTNAVQKYGCAMGGYDMSALTGSADASAVGSGCGFGFTPASPASINFANSALIGCDDGTLEVTRAATDAILDNKAENAKALITQPVPVAQQTCLDQYAKLASANAGTYSNPGGTNPSVASIVEQPLKETWKQFTSGKLAGSISSVMNESFSDISKTFNSGLSAITGGITTAKSKLSSVFSSGGSPLNVPATNCDTKEQAWLISQCIEMPELPKISNIIGGKIAELQGAVDRFGNLITSPERLLEAVCSKANSKVQKALGGFTKEINAKFDTAADKITKPLSDVTNTINNIPSKIIP